MEQIDVRLTRLQNLYNVHLQLFIHSNDFVQQRTSQFSTFNTILFAISGIFLNDVFNGNSDKSIIFMLGILAVSIMGLWSSIIWYFSYRRSAVYRNVHRLTLLNLDREMQILNPCENLQESPFLCGPFQLRHMVMYENEDMGCFEEPLRTNFFSKKRESFNVESIPIISSLLWVIILSSVIYFLIQIIIS